MNDQIQTARQVGRILADLDNAVSFLTKASKALVQMKAAYPLYQAPGWIAKASDEIGNALNEVVERRERFEDDWNDEAKRKTQWDPNM